MVNGLDGYINRLTQRKEQQTFVPLSDESLQGDQSDVDFTEPNTARLNTDQKLVN